MNSRIVASGWPSSGSASLPPPANEGCPPRPARGADDEIGVPAESFPATGVELRLERKPHAADVTEPATPAAELIADDTPAERRPAEAASSGGGRTFLGA